MAQRGIITLRPSSAAKGTPLLGATSYPQEMLRAEFKVL